jgi:hypothetical protein
VQDMVVSKQPLLYLYFSFCWSSSCGPVTNHRMATMLKQRGGFFMGDRDLMGICGLMIGLCECTDIMINPS